MKHALLALALALALVGCVRTPACYEVLGINVPARVAFVFDACKGELHYQNLPPPPIKRAAPEA